MSHRPLLVCVLALVPLAACQCEDDLFSVGGALAGTVCDDETGLPLSWKKVRLQTGGSDRQAETTSDGKFSIPAVPAGKATLIIPGTAGDREVEVTVESDQTTQFWDSACRGDPDANGVGRVEGLICDRHTGAWVTQAQVQVVLDDGSSVDTVTDDDGAFVLEDVPAGERILTVFAVGYQRSYLIEIFPGETTTIAQGNDCSPPAADEGFVRGALCDPSTGGPLVGAQVHADDSSGDAHEDVTDTLGEFLLGPMRQGPTTVMIERSPDVALAIPVVVRAGEDVTVPSPFECGTIITEPPGPGDGDLEGRVCAPDGTTWLAGAQVYVDLPGGERVETTTDGDGRYTLQGLPPGTWQVHIVAGSFETVTTVVIDEDETTVVIADSECAINTDDVKLAVVAGMWDDVRTVLLDVGIDEGVITDFDFGWAEQLMGDPTYLATFDIVFINCGAEELEFASSPTLQANLRQYVQNGGSLYVSDQAYDVVELTFPSYIEFYGSDTAPSAAELGADTMSIQGSITDSILAASLGNSYIELHYPLPYWAMIESVSSDVRVFIRGDADSLDFDYLPNIPHTVSFRPGNGKVVYSSFHQEPGINIQQEQVLQLLVFQL